MSFTAQEFLETLLPAGTILSGDTGPFAMTLTLGAGVQRELIPHQLIPNHTVGDRLVDRAVSATYVQDYPVILSTFGSWDEEVFIGGVPDNVATYDAGMLKYISDGTARAAAYSRSYPLPPTVLTEQVTFARTGGTVTDTFISFAPGSLAAHAASQVNNRLGARQAQGKTPVQCMPLYTTQNHAGAVYVRNPDCWAADIDLTCISPWNSRGANTRAGTLITPRHIILAKHFPLSVGDTVRFVDSNGAAADTTVIGQAVHATADIQVCTLAADIPSVIARPVKVLPVGWEQKLPDWEPDINSGGYGIPGLCLDQEEKALVSLLDAVSLNSGGTFQFYYPSYPSPLIPYTSLQADYYEDKIGGDSGNPAFLIVNNELVLLGCWYGGGGGNGPSVAAYRDDTNALIAASDTNGGVATGYTLTPINLSGFNTYT